MSELHIDVNALSPALQTAYGYLAEGNWRNANDCFDLELKQSPLDPYACLGKAMTACYLKTPDELNFCSSEILENPFFSAALKYADGQLKNDLTLLVVRLNYERQKTLAQKPAIDLPYDRSGMAAAAAEVGGEHEPQAVAGRANWNADDYARTDNDIPSAGDGDEAAGEDGEKQSDDQVDVVGGGKNGKKSKKRVIIPIVIAASLVVIAGGALAAWFYLIPVFTYNKAVDLINAKQFDEGLAIFEELGDFSDAPTQYQTGLYVKALNYLAQNDFENSQAILEELGDFKDSQELIATIGARRVTLEIKQIAAAQVGDIVTFGKYEIDGNEANGEEELTWLVLNNRDDLVTLLTEQSIAAMRYNFNSDPTNWRIARCGHG